MLVLLALVLLPAVVSACHTSELHQSFGFWAWAHLARGLSLIALLLFLLWRNGEPLGRIGWRFRGRDLLLGILLFVLWWLIQRKLPSVLFRAGLTGTPGSAFVSHPEGLAAAVLCAATLVAVVVWEESFFRGYLLLRLRGLGANAVVALLASALLFSSQHGYQGQVGLVLTGLLGILSGAVYLWRKNLTAPIVMHLLLNLAAFYPVLWPLFRLLHALKITG